MSEQRKKGEKEEEKKEEEEDEEGERGRVKGVKAFFPPMCSISHLGRRLSTTQWVCCSPFRSISRYKKEWGGTGE